MSFSQSSSGKKSRNQRNKERDKDQKKENVSETPISSKADTVTEDKKGVKHEGFAPQPQRTNRRQRPNDHATTNTPACATPPVPQERKERTENVVVDHSHLKRETEEIANLTKKFTKREITSNWHRYSALEGNLETKYSEDNVPADFSDLLQVPVSRGGHLLLKEEQEWSAVSGSELGGYFALDLKLLGQSLACLPLHEQLRLPKHMLSEEEVKHFENLAEQSKKCYSTNKIEDPNAKVFQLLTNLIQNEESIEQRSDLIINKDTKIDKEDIKDQLVILDVENSNSILKNSIEIENNPNTQLHTSDITENSESYIESVCTGQDLKSTSLVVEEKLESSENEEIIQLSKDKGQIIDTNKLSIDNKSTNPMFDEYSIVTNNHIKNKIESEQKVRKTDENIFEESSISETNVKKSIICAPNKSDSKTNELNGVIFSQPKDKRSLKNIITEPGGVAISSKVADKIKDITLEEDDDLDYLLSLKKPVNSQTKEEFKLVSIKDTSFMPGGTSAKEGIEETSENPSELDDWLDSVLQD